MDILSSRRSDLNWANCCNKLKYRADPSAVDSIAETAAEFLTEKWCVNVDLIVPVPPSNTGRKRQPVLEVAAAISDGPESNSASTAL